MPFDESSIDHQIEILQSAYKGIERHSTQIKANYEELSDNRVSIRFLISEGPVAKIRNITFRGAGEFSEEALKVLVRTKESGSWCWSDASSRLNYERISEDKRILDQYYQAHGYATFKILDVEPQLNGDKTGYDLLYHLSPGEKYLVSGLAFEDGGSVLIGGQNPGEGNIIAGHDSTGVLMMFHPGVPAGAHVQVSGNSIYNNAEIGIDLMPNTWDFGSTPNDTFDSDLGANGLQNFPEIASAISLGTTTTIDGFLQSAPNQVPFCTRY